MATGSVFNKVKNLVIFSIFLTSLTCAANEESIVTVPVAENRQQAGLLIRASRQSNPQILVVVVPGYPTLARVFKPILGSIAFPDNQGVSFVVRERQRLLNGDIAVLVVDCRSDFADSCPDTYQASPERFHDLKALIDRVLADFPSLQKKWVIATSRGVITSASVVKYAGDYFEGVIHTAGVSDVMLAKNLHFEKTATPQYFYHHIDDPCEKTRYSTTKTASEAITAPLVTVYGGSGFRGQPCHAFTQHGFKGIEDKVMAHIVELVTTGKLPSVEIR